MKSAAYRDRRIAELCEQLVDIEERLIPTGLHVFGRGAESAERADLLRMVVSFDRPEHGARALTKLVAEGFAIDSYEELLQPGAPSESRELVDGIVRKAIDTFCASGADAAAQFLQAQ